MPAEVKNVIFAFLAAFVTILEALGLTDAAATLQGKLDEYTATEE